MKKTLYYSCIMIVFFLNAYCQGSWNMKYLPIDSLNNSFIYKSIKLDFKSNEKDTLTKKMQRVLLSKRDVIDLKIGGILIKFIEKWELYVDHGSLRDQYLESIDEFDSKKIHIKDIFLESINGSLFTFEVSMEFVDVCDSKTPIKELSKKEKVVIDKSKIKGFLIRI